MRRPWILLALVVLAWLAIGAATGPLAGKLSEVQTNDETTFLPTSAESTQVAALQRRFADQQTVPALVVLARAHGLTAQDRAWAASLDLPRAVGPIPSRDGKALEIVVPLTGDQAQVTEQVQQIRDRLGRDRPAGLASYVTGPAGFTADLAGAFAGIDGVLLLVALTVVLLILLVVYRSPILPFAVLLSALFALALASGVVYVLADHGVLTLNGQGQGILSILVVGAATDYALLLAARYREELREHESRFAAMRTAYRQSVGPILASGMTVILALLCLLASDLNSTRSLGPVGALGIAGALLSALTFLPAVLALLGRVAFWPARPRFGSEHPERSGIWGRVARLVGSRPRVLWAGTGLVLVVLAAFLPTLRAGGTSQSDVFLHAEESVTGQQVAGRHFPGGNGSPAVVIGPAGSAQQMVQVAGRVPGVASAATVGPGGRPGGRPQVVDGLAQVQVVLSAAPDSDAAITTVERLRAAEHAAVPKALVGGRTAASLDTRTTAEHDRLIVIPLVLLVILVLLALLLRAVVAAVLLLATVVLSFAATLGVSALVFNHLLGFPGADPSVPLYGFVFLVALGVDYNIFLMSRAREESRRLGTREGVLRALTVTGGVITSAGVVLAATFSALTVIPLLFLAQIAFIVAFGVLLDTLVVRSVLVPAAAVDLGDRLWWPGRAASGPPRPGRSTLSGRGRRSRSPG
ncbi:MAG TPA: MMPL family transporter [Marmoricola sp.]|nr:MMPL family transporter [Marmoricola sp.]